MCLSVGLVPVCVIGYLDCVLRQDVSIPGPCVCEWLFRLCPEDQMCLSVGLVPVCVIGYLDCVLRTRCVYPWSLCV